MARLTQRAAVALAALAFWAFPAQAQTSASDFTSASRYDIANRLVGTIMPDPDGSGSLHFAAVRNTYDVQGRIIRSEKGELATWQSEAVDPSAWTGFTVFSKVETSYDGLDRKLVQTEWGWDAGTSSWIRKNVTQFSYDSLGRTECTAVRMNSATWSSLPTSACTLATTGAEGPDRITKNVYDTDGRLLKVVKGYGQTTANGLPQLQQDYATNTYTPNGQVSTLKDANGNLTTYTYDGFDRLVAWAFPSKTTIGSSAPCTIGTISETTDAFGNTVAGPSEARTTGDDCEKYAYDRNGNRTKLMKRDGDGSGSNRVIRYAYDALNRNTIKDVPGGTASDVYYGYDAQGLQTFARFASASGVGITNVYDGFGGLASTTNDMGSSALTIGYQYDAAGNRSQMTYPDSSYFTYVYDGLNRLTTIKDSGSTAIVSDVFDNQGRLVSQTRGAVTTTLGYDIVSRPTTLTNDLAGTTSDVTTTFGYNSANQITAKVRTNSAYSFAGYVDVSRPYATNGLNQYTTAGPASFAYDDNGNLTSDGTNTYSYDVENRMTGVVTPVSSITLNYDPTGRLWQVVLPNKTQTFTYDGDALIGDNAVNASGATTSIRYVHGPGVDDPMIEYISSSGSPWQRLSFQSDHQGSIVSLADASGAKYAINAYDEYGITTSAFYGRFGFTGQAWIPQIGLYYYKARMYSPTLGRFMQTDPIGYADQNNLYTYVGNDPIDGRDSTGLYDNTGSLFEPKGNTCGDGGSNCVVYGGFSDSGTASRGTGAAAPAGAAGAPAPAAGDQSAAPTGRNDPVTVTVEAKYPTTQRGKFGDDYEYVFRNSRNDVIKDCKCQVKEIIKPVENTGSFKGSGQTVTTLPVKTREGDGRFGDSLTIDVKPSLAADGTHVVTQTFVIIKGGKEFTLSTIFTHRTQVVGGVLTTSVTVTRR